MRSIGKQAYPEFDHILKGWDPADLPALVPIAEVPRYLGHVSRSKVYELVASGELIRVRIGSRAFVSGESIAAFLKRVLASGHIGDQVENDR